MVEHILPTLPAAGTEFAAKVRKKKHIRKRVRFFYLFACEIQKIVVILQSQSE
jgi:hypothetical protein